MHKRLLTSAQKRVLDEVILYKRKWLSASNTRFMPAIEFGVFLNCERAYGFLKKKGMCDMGRRKVAHIKDYSKNEICIIKKALVTIYVIRAFLLNLIRKEVTF